MECLSLSLQSESHLLLGWGGRRAPGLDPLLWLPSVELTGPGNSLALSGTFPLWRCHSSSRSSKAGAESSTSGLWLCFCLRAAKGSRALGGECAP